MNKQQRARYIVGAIILLVTVATASAQNGRTIDDLSGSDVLRNWDEMMHYALIGNWELAQGYGEALLAGDPDPLDLLVIAESERYEHSYRNLTMLRDNTVLSEIAAELMDLIEQGRFLRRTDPKTIAVEVERLSGTTRGRMLAIQRLRDSGEWAVPIMVEVLRDPRRTNEIPMIEWALPQLGRDAVNPLVVVLQKARNTNVRVIAAEALGKIGYRAALPYLREILQADSAAPELQRAARTAINSIMRADAPGAELGGAEASRPAADLFLKLALDYYNHVNSLAVPANQDFANVWFWNQREGLVKERVGRGAFDELMTMRNCEDAIRLNPESAEAIALWISAFFRLEAEGHPQPAYFGRDHADAATYALTSGPDHLHRVLRRALDNQNRPVALSAIQTLRLNAGQQSLLYALDGRQPLVAALGFADREVRYSAALAIAGVLPDRPFRAANQVMVNLAEALRQQGRRYAIVADPDQQRRNTLVTSLRNDGGFRRVVAADNLALALRNAADLPGIDLLVMAQEISSPDVNEAIDLIKQDYRLAFVPTIIITPTPVGARAEGWRGRHSFVAAVLGANLQTIMDEAAALLAANNARAFDPALADTYAYAAAAALRDLAVTGNTVLHPATVEEAIVAAAEDERESIQADALQTLARIDSATAQRKIAALALDDVLPMEMRLLAFRCLAISAKQYGEMLLTSDIDDIYGIVSNLDEDPQLRTLAAQAYGSLDLPAARISELILTQATFSAAP